MTAATTATTALVIVESHFGNTRTIAQAVAAGLTDAGVRASVVDAARAGALPADLDLLVVGAPTHSRGLPTAGSRAAARKRGATATAGGGGVREWLATATIPARTRVAVFDTVTARNWLSGSAARAVAKMLRRAGRGEPAVKSFVVGSSRGPLADGEEAAARAWGREWAAQTGGRRSVREERTEEGGR